MHSQLIPIVINSCDLVATHMLTANQSRKIRRELATNKGKVLNGRASPAIAVINFFRLALNIVKLHLRHFETHTGVPNLQSTCYTSAASRVAGLHDRFRCWSRGDTDKSPSGFVCLPFTEWKSFTL